jgi:deoxycytidylate deaminase
MSGRGCPLDDDGDGNCARHPHGCPRPVLPPHVVEYAVTRGARSPCGKSKRGAVVFDPYNGEIISGGSNRLPDGVCAAALPVVNEAAAEACRRSCGTRCVHAEAKAILRTYPHDRAGRQLEIVHVKVVDGAAVASGPPSCVPCAALILEARIEAAWLLHEYGWIRYMAADFYRLSCEAKGLPTP